MMSQPPRCGIIDRVARTQLLMYGFGPDADFEGRLLGALERLESGGTLRVLDTLFLHIDAETGELSAVSLHGGDRLVAPLLEFRLDPAARRRATRKALRGGAVDKLAGTLQPGSAIAAVLVEHVWAGALEDAVSRTGGTPLASELVDATALEPELVARFMPAQAQPDPSSDRDRPGDASG
jgi:hypothetical protein